MIDNVVSSEFDEKGYRIRKIRSFVRRQGRLTKGQQYALENYWPVFGIEFSEKPLDFCACFSNSAPVVVEVGFGMGASLVTMAQENPQLNFLGIEVHTPGIGACLAAVRLAGINNLRVICHDAVEVLASMIPDSSLHRVQLYFPDPWHKARHHKRRIVQPPFAGLVMRKLKLGGEFHMATDWQAYAEHMLTVMSHIDGYRNLSQTGDWVPKPDFRPMTKFERRGQRLGHNVWDILFARIK